MSDRPGRATFITLLILIPQLRGRQQEKTGPRLTYCCGHKFCHLLCGSIQKTMVLSQLESPRFQILQRLGHPWLAGLLTPVISNGFLC